MSRKIALIIGNSQYEDENLSQLLTPDADVTALAEVLRNPEIGEFAEVTTLINQPTTAIRRGIANFFSGRGRDELLLLYFSGHGVRDERGQLFLAVKDTEHNLLRGTAIPASFVTEEMDNSRSRRQVLILDCCHSGAFARGMKAATGTSAGTATAFEGKGSGRVVLTATDATQYAWEGDRVIGRAENSVFTHYLIQGLRTGEADLTGDGRITLDELFDYVYENVVNETPLQTPSKWSYGEQGEIVIARNQRRAVAPAESQQTAAAHPVERTRPSQEKAKAPPLASQAMETREQSRQTAQELQADDLKLSKEEKISPLRRRLTVIGLIVLTACLPVLFILGPRLLGGKSLNGSPNSAPVSPGLVQLPGTASSDQPGIFDPAALTPTPTPPVAANLTNNREGGYEKLSLLLDSQGLLHLTFFSRIPRRGDYYHQQMTPEGTWTEAESLTAGFDYLWNDLVQARHPQGYICILWRGISQLEGDAYFQRCQNGPGGSFSPAEIWWSRSNSEADFSPVILPDGSVQAAFNQGHKIAFKDHILSDELAAAGYAHLVMDKTGGYHLVWFRYGKPYSLEYSYSNDGGASWSPVQRLTSEEDAPDAGLDLEADQQGNLHLIWKGFRDSVYYRRWTPLQGWSEAVKISPLGCSAKIAINAEGLARVAQGCWYGVFFLEQLPDGAWLPAYQVSNAGDGLKLDLAVDERDRSHIVWLANDDIFYAAVEARGSP